MSTISPSPRAIMCRAFITGMPRDPAVVEAGHADGAARRFDELERRLRAGGDAFSYASGFHAAIAATPKHDGA